MEAPRQGRPSSETGARGAQVRVARALFADSGTTWGSVQRQE